jgi:hypothetical protein
LCWSTAADLSLRIRDIEQMLYFEDLTDVVLVGRRAPAGQLSFPVVDVHEQTADPNWWSFIRAPQSVTASRCRCRELTMRPC